MRLLRLTRARVKNLAREHQLRYLSYREQLLAWILNRNHQYEILTIEDVRNQRRSDTLFILGSGPSLLKLTDSQWHYVGSHDSFGINFSFLVDFNPTYHIMNDGKSEWLREHMRSLLAPRRQTLSPTIWFISNRHTRRLIHPLYAPELFPIRPRVCIFRQPPRIILERDRPFAGEDFKQAILYRGTLSLVLYLALQLAYKRIVLLGVDLHTPKHFFDNMPEMQGYLEYNNRYQSNRFGVRAFTGFETMIPDGNASRPFDEYLYALNKLHLQPRGIAFYVGNPDNMLFPRIPYFQEW